MDSEVAEARKKKKQHAVFVPFPAQGHVTPMMKLAKLLHHNNGFHITFVNTHFNHNRLLRSSSGAVDGFDFVSIPDGLPPSDEDATQHLLSLCLSVSTNFLSPFRDLLASLAAAPPITCIISDINMSFTADAARELGVPNVWFSTPSACGTMCYLHYQKLIDEGLVPLRSKEEGYLDTPVDWVPGMEKKLRLRDFPTFIRTTDPDDAMLRWRIAAAARMRDGAAVVMNTFEDLEGPVLDAMRDLLGIPVYSLGPLDLLLCRILPPESPLRSLGSSFRKEETSCLRWLDGRPLASVAYVNFGTSTELHGEQIIELAMGLSGSGRSFLWVIRHDLVKGSGAVLPAGFLEETAGRGMVVKWCPQEEVLRHPAVGEFLTHCGWNSTMESLCGGVRMICWPFFAEQQTNCRFACGEWGVGVEIGGGADGVIRREEVELAVREVVVAADDDDAAGKKEEMRARASRWKELAVGAAAPGGSSFVNFDRLVNGLIDGFC